MSKSAERELRVSPRFRLVTEQACSTTSAEGRGLPVQLHPLTEPHPPPHPLTQPHLLTKPPEYIPLCIGQGLALLSGDDASQL